MASFKNIRRTHEISRFSLCVALSSCITSMDVYAAPIIFDFENDLSGWSSTYKQHSYSSAAWTTRARSSWRDGTQYSDGYLSAINKAVPCSSSGGRGCWWLARNGFDSRLSTPVLTDHDFMSSGITFDARIASYPGQNTDLNFVDNATFSFDGNTFSTISKQELGDGWVRYQGLFNSPHSIEPDESYDIGINTSLRHKAIDIDNVQINGKYQFEIDHENRANGIFINSTPDNRRQIKLQVSTYAPGQTESTLGNIDPDLPTVVVSHGHLRGVDFDTTEPTYIDDEIRAIKDSFLSQNKGVNVVKVAWEAGYSKTSIDTSLDEALITAAGDSVGGLGSLGALKSVASSAVACLANLELGNNCKASELGLLPVLGTVENIADAALINYETALMRAGRHSSGVLLSEALAAQLPDNYDQHLEFVGFGEGAVVNAFALAAIAEEERALSTATIGYSGVAIPLQDPRLIQKTLPKNVVDTVQTFGYPTISGAASFSVEDYAEQKITSFSHVYADADVHLEKWSPGDELERKHTIEIDQSNIVELGQVVYESINGVDSFSLYENSPSAAGFFYEIPTNTVGFAFDSLFMNANSSQGFTLYFNGNLLLDILASDFHDSWINHFVPLTDYSGQSGIFEFGLNSFNHENAVFSFSNLGFLLDDSEVIEVNEPRSMSILLVVGIVALTVLNRRSKA